MYNQNWFKEVVMKEKRRSFPLVDDKDSLVDKNNPSTYPNREYIWFFLAKPISPFMRGFNQTCRWLWEEQDMYNPKYCDLYFKPTPNSNILIKVDNIHKQFI